MTDTERLNLIEHYQWQIFTWSMGKDKFWQITGKFGGTQAHTSLRMAFDAAYKAQAEWAMS